VTFRGRPILFGVSIPSAARRASQAERFVAFLLSADGRILRQQRFDALERPEFVGGRVPKPLRAAAGR
jgi:ABC-type molybdate transport system substrate-binding protein